MTEQEKNSEALHQLGVKIKPGYEFVRWGQNFSPTEVMDSNYFLVNSCNHLVVRKIPIYREPVKQDMGKIAEFRDCDSENWRKGQFLTIDSDGLFVFKHEGAVGFYNHARIKD